MNKYSKELIILLCQLFMFYIYPLSIKLSGPLGMVLALILITFILALVLGALSGSPIKYFYPLIIAILFIPSVFIYYNESALIHSLWYFVVSAIGLLAGVGVRAVFIFIKKGGAL